MTAFAYYYVGRSLGPAEVNLPPVIADPIPDMLLREDDPAVTFDLAEVFLDPNGDGLTFTLDGSPPAWITITDGVLSLEPTDGDAGAYAFSVRATDDGDGELSVADVFSVGVLAAASGSIPDTLRPASRWPEAVWGTGVWPADGPHRKPGNS